ncbi:MAG TPA: Maf family protein [Anaerolineae bacterium]|nr:Maf family protein [Anaerolineae bacterium]
MDELERFWANIFSEDPTLIAEACSQLGAAERAAVVRQLRAITADLDRQPDQRRAAQVALASIEANPARRIMLASGSPRRRELIALLGLPFAVALVDVDETQRPGEDPAAMVLRLSQEKARAAQYTVQLSNYPTILLSADTTVSLDGEVLGKPGTADEARAMLARLRGRWHQVFTAITLIDTAADRYLSDLAATDVRMRNFSDAEVETYIASGDPFDKAGGYAIQHNGFSPVEEVRGCYTNVVGLPLCHVARALRALGVEPVTDVTAACQPQARNGCQVRQLISQAQSG